MKRICVVVPTYNRPECIREWMEVLANSKEAKDIDFYISDSSEDNTTEEIVASYMNKTKLCIVYNHIKDYCDKTTDYKVAMALMKVREEYEYVYLCGDGLIINMEYILQLIEKYRSEEWDAIHFCRSLETEIITFNSGKEFAYKCGWYVTYYGATILSTRLLGKIDFQELLRSFRNTGFLIWIGIFSGLAYNNIRVVAIKEFPVKDNPYKKVNSSYQPGRFMEFWVRNWAKAVESLPPYYDGIKDYLCKDIGEKLNLYGFDNLIRLRHSDNYDKDIFSRYESELPKVTNKKLFYLHFMAIAPIVLLDFLLLLKKKLAWVYHKIKQ